VPGLLVQVATQINLLAAQSTVVEGQLVLRSLISVCS
jgi:hypothetical protein